MAATTRWKDTVVKSVDEAVKGLIDTVEPEEKVTSVSWDNWNFQKIFEKNEILKLNGKNVEYNYIKYSYVQTTVGDGYVEDRELKREGFIIVYSSGAEINYIIDENSCAKKLIRRLMSYTGKSEIEKNTFDFTNNFFVWLIFRVYNANYNIEISPEEKRLKLDSIKGFKGDTDDLQSKVSASGETVMNIISTLSFLLENNNLNQVKIDLNYTGHSNISLMLQKGTVNANLDVYMGVFDQEVLEEAKIAKLYLTVYLEILPLLFQEYNTDIGNDLWNMEVYIDFMKDVGESLTQKIKNKIAILEDDTE